MNATEQARLETSRLRCGVFRRRRRARAASGGPDVQAFACGHRRNRAAAALK